MTRPWGELAEPILIDPARAARVETIMQELDGFTVSSGNVYADLGLENAEARLEQARALMARPKERHRIYVDREQPYPGKERA